MYISIIHSYSNINKYRYTDGIYTLSLIKSRVKPLVKHLKQVAVKVHGSKDTKSYEMK